MPLRSLRPYFEPGLRQVRRLWLPFVTIQVIGLAVVLSYFYVPGVDRVLDGVSDARRRGGIPFAALTLAFACGIVPEIFKSVTGVDRTFTRSRGTFVIHNLVLFAFIGSLAVQFYELLGYYLGDSRRPHIVIAKTAIDMCVWSPLVSVPLICFSFTLRSHGYHFIAALRQFGGAWYLREAVPVLIVNMAYWWPMGMLMYTLPPKMTFIYGAIGSAASAILLTAIASQTAREDDVPGKMNVRS